MTENRLSRWYDHTFPPVFVTGVRKPLQEREMEVKWKTKECATG
jgi:hypothetical protein